MADADWMKYKQLRGKDLPEQIHFHGAAYRLDKLFKRDFYAATGMYRLAASETTPATPDRILLKIYHTEPLGIIPLGWLGRRLCAREIFYYEAVDGIDGLARLLGRFGASGYVREYVPGCHLREYRKAHQLDRDFYVALKRQLGAIHARGLAHNDLSKPENILVGENGSPTIIDFQIAARFAWRQPLFKQIGRRILRYLQSLDTYHLNKLHRRARPLDFSVDELKAARKKGPLLFLHGLLLRRPYRTVRHFFMGRFLRVNAAGIISADNAAVDTESSRSKMGPPPARAA